MKTTSNWMDWFKSNFLEVVTLILVLVLLGKAFSAPVEKASAVPEVAGEESLAKDVTLEVPEKGVETGKETQPLAGGATTEPVAEKTLGE